MLISLEHDHTSGGSVNQHLQGRGDDIEIKAGTKGEPGLISTVSSVELGPGRPRSGFHICAWDFAGPGDRKTMQENGGR